MYLSKRVKSTLAIIILLLYLLTCLISYYKFLVANPFITSTSLLRILTTDIEYIEMKHYPEKVILAQSDWGEDGLYAYMNTLGFGYEEQLGSLYFFSIT